MPVASTNRARVQKNKKVISERFLGEKKKKSIQYTLSKRSGV